MLIDVEGPLRNLLLNAWFCSIVVLSLIGIVPWKALESARVSQLLRWLAVPVLGLAIAYESLMPERFDIRLDVFLLLPAYGLAIATSAARWRAWRRSGTDA